MLKCIVLITLNLFNLLYFDSTIIIIHKQNYIRQNIEVFSGILLNK